MPGLIDDATATSIRASLGITLTNVYTRTPVSSGAEDAHGDAAISKGDAVSGVACRYEANARLRTGANGTTQVFGPKLVVAADDPLKPGDQVSEIRNAQNRMLAAGPFEVGQRIDDDPLGVTLLVEYELLGADQIRGQG